MREVLERGDMADSDSRNEISQKEKTPMTSI